MNLFKMMVYRMMQNNPLMSNPTIKNAINMGNHGDFAGVEKIARNMCQQRGIDADKAVENLKNSFSFFE